MGHIIDLNRTPKREEHIYIHQNRIRDVVCEFFQHGLVLPKETVDRLIGWEKQAGGFAWFSRADCAWLSRFGLIRETVLPNLHAFGQGN
jgi:hypothetical protein